MNKVIKENSKMDDGHRRQMGMNKPESNPKTNIVGGLIDANNEKTVAPKQLPFPLEHFDSMATELFIQALNLRKMVDTAKNNPEVYKRNKTTIDTLQTKLESLAKDVVDISNIVNTIT